MATSPNGTATVPTRVDIGTATGPPIGIGGPLRYAGYVAEEALWELRGLLWDRVVKEMVSNDPIVGGSLLAYSHQVRKVSWHTKPADTSSRAAQIAEEFEGGLHDMEDTWEDMLSEALSHLPWGWALMEWSAKRRRGDNADPKLRSKFTDGRVGFRAWDLRPQETRLRWEFDDDGRAIALVQQMASGQMPRGPVPLAKALHFRTQSRKQNPEGVSILRNAWRSWKRKKNIENIEGIGAERDLVGLLRLWVPPEIMAPDATPDQMAMRQKLEHMAANVRRNETDFLMLPSIYDDDGHRLFDADLMSTSGARQFDLGAIVERENRAIALSMLTDLILMGHENVGSLALYDGKAESLAAGISAVCDGIASVITNQAWPELMRLNSYPMELCPSLTHGNVEVVDLAELGAFIQSVAKAGAPLFGTGTAEDDADLTAALLKKAGLPTPAGTQET